MKYVKGFDTVRALAVFLVITDQFHWGPLFRPNTVAAAIEGTLLPNGRFGVTLFFVLSGFLITSILLHEKIYTEGKQLTIIKNFFIRRTLRIFPIYYLTIFLCCLFNFQFVIDNIAYFLTYTSNMLQYHTKEANPLLHTWSLAVEEQFYLLWPWLIIMVNRKYLKHMIIACILIGVASKYVELYLLHNGPSLVQHESYSVASCLDALGIGSLYAYIRLDKQKCARFEKNFAIALPLLLFLSWRISPLGGVRVLVIYYRLMESIVALAVIIFVINNPSEWIRRYILENKYFNFIGKISYGLYLYHYTFGKSYDRFIIEYTKCHPGIPGVFTNFYSVYCIKLALLTGISWLSYKLVEQPILKLRRKFHYTDTWQVRTKQ